MWVKRGKLINLKIDAVLIISSLFVVFLASCASGTGNPPPTVTATTITPATIMTQLPVSSGVQEITVNLVAQNMAFDKNTITAPAGASVKIILDNRERIPHNFALYADSRASQLIYKGENITARSIEYKFTAPTKPGTYLFRCDSHPSTMKGDFIVK